MALQPYRLNRYKGLAQIAAHGAGLEPMLSRLFRASALSLVVDAEYWVELRLAMRDSQYRLCAVCHTPHGAIDVLRIQSAETFVQHK